METKLTLRLNKRIIDKAKDYARNHNISLSKMVESYLESITKQKAGATEISPLVESLSGVIKLDDNFDNRKDYSNYLAEKYK
ncbi:MAG: hypothetical protein A2X18_03880 [Bacteroidetes bacterium GWF2_40_14]|jgi:hypothetical protein|nr:MAG: hypothetical protein A2X18_03880 [Bacteroidetes bacterium GWF2_40_14]